MDKEGDGDRNEEVEISKEERLFSFWSNFSVNAGLVEIREEDEMT